MQHRIRLDKIDAPEKGQPFGDASRKHLAAFVADKIVEVEWSKKDKYGRILGTVWAMMPTRTDVNLQMVKDGCAWHYTHFDNTLSYVAAETAARLARRGLWEDPVPIPPSVFGKANVRFHTHHNLTIIWKRKAENRQKRTVPCDRSRLRQMTGLECAKCMVENAPNDGSY